MEVVQIFFAVQYPCVGWLPLDRPRLTTRERGVNKAMYTARLTGSNEVRARSLRQVLVDVLAASMVPCSWVTLELLLVSTDGEQLIAVRDGKSPEAISSMTCNQSIKSAIRPLSFAGGLQRSQLERRPSCRHLGPVTLLCCCRCCCCGHCCCGCGCCGCSCCGCGSCSCWCCCCRCSHLLLLFLFLLLPHLCCRSDACCPLLICHKHRCFSADLLSQDGCGRQQIFCARARRSTVDVSLDHLSALCIARLFGCSGACTTRSSCVSCCSHVWSDVDAKIYQFLRRHALSGGVSFVTRGILITRFSTLGPAEASQTHPRSVSSLRSPCAPFSSFRGSPLFANHPPALLLLAKAPLSSTGPLRVPSSRASPFLRSLLFSQPCCRLSFPVSPAPRILC